MAIPENNENALEDIEEGEISDDAEAFDECVANDDDDNNNNNNNDNNNSTNIHGDDDDNGNNNNNYKNININKVPILQRKASLDDLAASRLWNEAGRREDASKVIEDGQGGNQWRREGLAYGTSNGNYSHDLYNMAWARAVQSRPRFPLENSNNSKEENLKNGRSAPRSRDSRSDNSASSGSGRSFYPRREDDYINVSASSSSDTSERTVSGRGRVQRIERGILENGQRGSMIKGAMDDLSDDDEKFEPRGPNEREEGELEEGEIEVGSGSSRSLTSSPERSVSCENVWAGEKSERRASERLSRQRDKFPTKNFERRVSRPESRDRTASRLNSYEEGRQRLKDHHKEKRVADIREMVKNVTVKDAQKSFISVCRQLHTALECLSEIVQGSIQDRPSALANSISNLVSEIFSGIRAAYAVWNTAIGKQQERDKNAFPRLLEFVNSEAQRLFTRKQFKELEGMMMSISSPVCSPKTDFAEDDKAKQSLLTMQSSHENAPKPERRGCGLGELLGHHSLGQFKTGERISTDNESTAEINLMKFMGLSNNANDRRTEDSKALKPNEFNQEAFKPNEFTQASPSAESDSLASSNSSAIGSEPAECLSSGCAEFSGVSSYKPWDGPEELNYSDLPTPTREASPADLSNSLTQVKLKCYSFETEAFTDPSAPLAGGMQDETTDNASWRSMSEAISAVTSYQEKFGGRMAFASTRLPSPTPSEDCEEGEASYLGGAHALSNNDQCQQGAEERQMRDADTNDNISVPSALDSLPCFSSAFDSQGLEPRAQNDTPAELELAHPQLQYNVSAGERGKPLNSASGPLGRVQLKSRDPRRRGLGSELYMVDLNKRPCQVDSNVTTEEQIAGTLPNGKHKADEDSLQEASHLKRQRNHSALSVFSGGMPMVMSGSGGWLEENTVIPSCSEWDQTSEMEIDSMGPLERSNGIITDSNDSLGREGKLASIESGSSNKRQKTESCYQSSTPVDSSFEVPQCQKEDIAIISKPRVEASRETVELDMTDVVQQTGNAVIPDTNMIPTVLKDIAVNPTMLMHLINQEQQRRLAQAAQKPEKYQQTNPPSGLSRPFLPNSVNDVAVNPSTLKPSNLEQKHTSQTQPVAAVRSATQTTSMVGDSWKPRMKPRDPRRVLHSNMFPKNESSVSANSKLNVTCAPVTREISMPLRGATTEVASKLTQGVSLPNIAQHFTEKLVSIAEMLGSVQTNSTIGALSSGVMQNLSQVLIGESNKETDAVELGQERVECSKFASVNNKGVTVQKHTGMTVPPSTQSLADKSLLGPEQNQQNPWGDVDHLLEGLDEHQRSAIQQERARRIEEQNKMFSAKKLCLVLDLDHTLLNSAKFSEVDPIHEEILRKKEEQDREKSQRQLFRFSHMGMWTKLRPGIWNFLERASKLYELHVYTMGNKVYATEMTKVLDPTGTLFSGRVISKGDEADIDGDDRLPKSKDLDGVLGMESAVVIIDDSARVWPHHKHNLIVVERYMYFPCSRRQFGMPGPSLLEIDHDERPEDGTLASSLAVIEKIHHDFFSNKLLNAVDVRDFLAAEQRRILMGCRILFSRVFPVGEAQPHLHPLWQMAEQFGAVCTAQIDEQVTHVVAISLGTDKVNWALATGRHVVHPGWLEASALLYRRANERDFSIVM